MRSPVLFILDAVSSPGDQVSRNKTADASRATCDLTVLLICLDNDNQIPTQSIRFREAVTAASDGSTALPPDNIISTLRNVVSCSLYPKLN